VGLAGHLAGERDLVDDLKGVLGALGGASGSVQNLSVAALLHQLAKHGGAEQQAALKTLLEGGKA
jgi:hypothetical protein